MTASPLTYSRFKAPDAANGTLDVYEAGSLQNRKTTYSNPGLSSQNTNPVQLNSLGEADIFYTGLARLVLKDESGSQIWDKDNIGLSGDTSTEWTNTLSATYSSATQFTLSGDQTTQYHKARRVKLVGSVTKYGAITASTYSNPNTTVTVTTDDSSSLDGTLSSVSTGFVSAINSSVPFFNSPPETHNADYTLVLSDFGKTLIKSAADTTTRTWTIPLNASVAFPIGTIIKMMNFDDNTITITATGAAVLYWLDGTDAAVSDADRTLGRRGSCVIQKTGTDEWIIEGNAGLY